MPFIIVHLILDDGPFHQWLLHDWVTVSAYMMWHGPRYYEQHVQCMESIQCSLEAFLSARENGYRLLRNVNPSRSRLIPTKHQRHSAQVTDNLRPFRCLNIWVHVLDLDAHFLSGRLAIFVKVVGCLFILFNTDSPRGLSHKLPLLGLEPCWTNDCFNHCPVTWHKET